ncbi:putative effector protein ec2 [Erysiphe neolycopersici]|uniref:Putative effector protein ec2 n=1 Tax=Erysiphe neolycopersici TaxID=212602 RepID=A0A420HZG1_9PEZI|nr:putative effector protein ec2 [Erysiphe neolycopersici]
MQVIHLILLVFTAIAASTPSGLKFFPRGHGDDDSQPQTCAEAVQSIPKCALSCIVQPPIDAGCKSAADFACTCEKKTKKAITKAETPCVIKECGLKEALAASRAGNAVCDACNVEPSDPSPSDPPDGDSDSYEYDPESYREYEKDSN